MKIRYTFLAILLLMGCFLGCNQVKRPNGLPETFPVTITIMQDGVPLEGAIVRTAVENTALAQWNGAGARITNASGKTEMYSYGFKGLIAGEHKIVVNKEICHRPPDVTDTVMYDEYEFFVDQKFWSANTTPLTIDVQSGTKAFTLDVEPFDPKTYDVRKFGKKLKK